MCPLCIGSALLAVTGASSAGGLAVIAARIAGKDSVVRLTRRRGALTRASAQARRAYSGIGTGEARCAVAVQLVPIEARMMRPIAVH